ncbi:TPA: hypothetical protein ACNVPH_006840, partial [Pseudomonas aeruginosa]
SVGGGSKVIVGYITNGGTIPIPTGYSPEKCSWIASAADNRHMGWPAVYSGNYVDIDVERRVFCGFRDDGRNAAYSVNRCTYVVTCS